MGHRAGYYDKAGVLRDMFQNHLLQLLSLTAMEPPALFEANALRDEKVKVLRVLRAGEQSVRGQYKGYRAEEGVAPDSQTPTYAALELFVDNWRWRGVPFYLRSGKTLKAKTTEVAIQFKRVPHLLFPMSPDDRMTPNILSLCLQPDEGIHLRFEAKVPGAGMRTRSVDMEFHYADDFARRRCRKPTSACCWTRCRGTPPSLRAPTRSSWPGGWSIRSSKAGSGLTLRRWPSTSRGVGGRPRRTICWPGMGGRGCWDAGRTDSGCGPSHG